MTTRATTLALPGLLARIAAAVARFFERAWDDGVWLVELDGRVHGMLRRAGAKDGWQLTWLDGADPRLTALTPADAADGPDAFGALLTRRFGPTADLRVTPVLAF